MKIITTLIGCATLMLCSCSPYYYAPNKGNIPNMREKNDVRIDAGFSVGLVSAGADLQFAYAPIDHLGVMVNGAFSKTQNYSKNNDTESQYLEAGLGYFTKFEDNRKWLFEVYGGGGKGNYSIWYNDYQTSKIDMNKYFIQPSLSYTHLYKNLEFGIASKFSGVNYDLKSFTVVDDMYHSNVRRIQNLVNRPMLLFWEPTFRFSGGFKNMKAYVSYTPSVDILQTGTDREVVNVSMGLRFTLNASRKKQILNR
ncbi:hypothetical protein [Dyadobacter frigoris]|uniref:Outer membrane protein beta-barrel domain-containing protein n=1 Tax=Dyadobacter frigoris TaxID=2576211 RepID=A0A4V6Y1Z2_9BACT|nr:hypothetical protein [Dyadobacter frigoris]TKT92003.1 hypothetical protein FDK13_12755 [Dyadobacter frigoris]